MPELEIHHEAGHAIDPIGQRTGVLAAVLAVALAIVSITSHRTHTDAIIYKSTANDKWSQYQAGRVKYHSLELGENLVDVMGVTGERASHMLDDRVVPAWHSTLSITLSRYLFAPRRILPRPGGRLWFPGEPPPNRT